jgi:hypothetical protein
MGNDLIVPLDDGWGDAAAENDVRTIRGNILKFADRRYTSGKEATLVPLGTKLVALATAAMWVRWEDNRPAQTIMRLPGGKLPEREDLGDNDPADWPLGLDGNPADPWRNTRLVYLVAADVTAEAFTFSTSSFGGRRAVSDLGDQIARMRLVHADAVPVIELQAADMPTRYGVKSRPLFKIVAWNSAAAKAAGEAVPAERQITAQDAEQEISQREMDDQIPF